MQYQNIPLVLKDKEGRENKVTVNLKYLPVKMKLDPSESRDNQGNLRVEVLDAADLPAADRNGFSDPYCKFSLNGKEIYKSKVQKKTLHPAWNEYFEVPVQSRTAAIFDVNVFDWDFGDKADHLGKAAINLEILEPFVKQEVTLDLDGKSGSIRLSLLFKPDYVTRSRQGSSTFHGTFAVPGKIVGAPVKGVGKGAVFVGGGVAKGASFLGRGFRRRKSNGQEVVEDADPDPMPSAAVANGSASPESPVLNHNTPLVSVEAPATPNSRMRSASGVPSTPNTGAGSSAETGTAKISIVSASGYPAGTKLEVRVLQDTSKGPKELFKTKPLKTKGETVVWDDSLEKRIPNVAADTPYRISVREHHAFGSGTELGDAEVVVDGQEREVRVGAGVVVIRTAFEAADAQSLLGSVRDSPRQLNSSAGAGGGMRRSFMGRRDRSVTPAGPGA